VSVLPVPESGKRFVRTRRAEISGADDPAAVSSRLAFWDDER